jgi:hypothetical protein
VLKQFAEDYYNCKTESFDSGTFGSMFLEINALETKRLQFNVRHKRLLNVGKQSAMFSLGGMTQDFQVFMYRTELSMSFHVPHLAKRFRSTYYGYCKP